MRGRHVALGVAIAVTAAGSTATLATRALFVSPATDSPRAADAVVVPSGDHGDRLAAAMELLRRGVSHTLVLDGTPDVPSVASLCRSPEAFEVVCLRPTPDSTRAEARAAASLAAQRGWRRLVLVTSTPHVSRAGLLFRRCLHGDLAVVGSRPPASARGRAAIVHEWLGYLYAQTVARRC